MAKDRENENVAGMSLLQHIESSLVNGVLPEDYRLP